MVRADFGLVTEAFQPARVVLVVPDGLRGNLIVMNCGQNPIPVHVLCATFRVDSSKIFVRTGSLFHVLIFAVMSRKVARLPVAWVLVLGVKGPFPGPVPRIGGHACTPS